MADSLSEEDNERILGIGIKHLSLVDEEIAEFLAKTGKHTINSPYHHSSFTSNPPATEVQYLQPISDNKFQAINLLSRLEADNSILLTRIESLESSLQSLLSAMSDECYAHGSMKGVARDKANECLNDQSYIDRLSNS